MVFDSLFVNLVVQLLIEFMIFPEKNAGMRNPLQVKRNIFEFPIIRSERAITAKVSQKALLLPRKKQVKIKEVVSSSTFGPRSKTVLSRKAIKNKEINNKFCVMLYFFIEFCCISIRQRHRFSKHICRLQHLPVARLPNMPSNIRLSF